MYVRILSNYLLITLTTKSVFVRKLFFLFFFFVFLFFIFVMILTDFWVILENSFKFNRLPYPFCIQGNRCPYKYMTTYKIKENILFMIDFWFSVNMMTFLIFSKICKHMCICTYVWNIDIWIEYLRIICGKLKSITLKLVWTYNLLVHLAENINRYFSNLNVKW